MIIISSIMLGGAHWYPAWAGWLVYIFLIPLFYIALSHHSLSWIHGFWWGFIFFGMHLWAGTELLMYYTSSVCLPFLIIVLYGALHTGVWFLFTIAVANIKKRRAWRACIWIVMTHIFFWFVYRHGLWCFDGNLGYYGALFWVPLAFYPHFLCIVHSGGIPLASLALITWSMVAALCICTRNIRGMGLWAGIILLFCLSNSKVMQQRTATLTWPSWIETMCWISYKYMNDQHPYDRVRSISRSIADAQNIDPRRSIFLLPESACPFAFNSAQHLMTWLYSDLAHDSWILWGGHRKEHDKLYNTLYIAHNAKVISYYDKKTLVPFFESQDPTYRRNYTEKNHFYAASHHSSSLLATPWGPTVPMICAELFLVTESISENTGIVRLCLAHDGWFIRNTYMPQLMALYVIIRAVAERSPYLYISHRYGFYTEQGLYKDLNCHC